MFWVSLRCQVKNMLHHKEFFFDLFVSTAVVLIAFCVDLRSYLGNDIMYRLPAWCYWGLAGPGNEYIGIYGSMNASRVTISLWIQLLLPFLATMAYAFCHYDAVKSGVLKELLPRTGAGAYYRSSACAVFVGGSLIIFIPLLLQQLLLLIVFPGSLPINNPGGYPVVDDYVQRMGIQCFAALQINHPYLYNLLLSVIPAVTGGVLAYCAYTLSLFFHRSRFLVLTLTGVVLWLVPQFAFQNDVNLGPYVRDIFAMQPSSDFAKWGMVFGALLAVNIVLTELKIHKFKDRLS